MATNFTGGATSNLDALSVVGTADAATVTQGGVAMPRMVLSTAQNTTSGTSIDFTSIPSWVKRITVMLNGVSTNGTSKLRIQIGAGSVETSGYAGSSSYIATATAASATFSAGFDCHDSQAAVAVRRGLLTLDLFGSNTWVLSGSFSTEDAGYSSFINGTKTTSGTLDRLRLTTANGTDTFDAGSCNLLLEG